MSTSDVPYASAISFPPEVARRLEVLGFAEQLRVLATESLTAFTVKVTNAPIHIPDSTKRTSLTTAAICGALLPLFDQEPCKFFLELCESTLKDDDSNIESATFGQNNPITSGFILLALCRMKGETSTAAKIATQKIQNWVNTPVGNHIHAFHGYPVAVAYNALRRLSKVHKDARASFGIDVEALLGRLAHWCRVQVSEQIALYHSRDLTNYDLGTLVPALLVSIYSNELERDSRVVTEAIRIIFSDQSDDGLWRATKPFWTEAGHGYYLAHSQIAAPVMRLMASRPDLFRQHERGLSLYVDWLRLHARRIPDAEVTGWVAESERQTGLIDSYVTLYTIRALDLFCDTASRINREDLLSRSGLKVSRKLRRWEKLLPTDLSKPVAQQIKNQLEQAFVTPLKNKRRLENYSAVLYGPPGTSKTAIAESLADALSEIDSEKWAFVTITPGDFISGGEQRAEINATQIFHVLSHLPRAVILFDEIDLLLENRDKGMATASGALRYMTTSMLTKFQALRKCKQNVFFLTTNKYGSLDPAMKRAGRFDLHLAVLPPDCKSRKDMVKDICKEYDADNKTSFLSKLDDGALDQISLRTPLFTYSELQSVLHKGFRALQANPAEDLSRCILDGIPNYPRAIKLSDYRNDREMLGLLNSTITDPERKHLESDGPRWRLW